MANLNILDGASASKYLKTSGVGSDVDPFVTYHTISKDVITSTVGTCNTSGNNTILAAPGAGKRWRIINWKFWNETTTPVKAVLKTTTIDIDAYHMSTEGAGVVDKIDINNDLILGTNEAIILNLSAATTVGYAIKVQEITV